MPGQVDATLAALVASASYAPVSRSASAWSTELWSSARPRERPWLLTHIKDPRRERASWIAYRLSVGEGCDVLSYTVTARKVGRRYSHRVGALIDAFGTALTLRSSGAEDIAILDDAGGIYEHKDLCRVFGLSEQGSVESALTHRAVTAEDCPMGAAIPPLDA